MGSTRTGGRGADGTDRKTDPYAATAATLRAALVREIAADGGLTDPAWREAFEEVPRHVFVPRYYEAGEAGSPGGTALYERLGRHDADAARRARWLAGVYSDAPLATRVRDGELVSSSSQPSLMARMLEALEVRDGDSVLEIGTGTGYNAALLAHRLGEDRVTTVDIDPDLTDTARDHLAAAGYHPAVVTGDGALGCPSRAPFDRIIATCAVTRLPPAWLGQCRSGALILAPLATGLIALRVADTRHGEGRFLTTPAYFVPLRGSEPPPPVRTKGLPTEPLLEDSFRFLLNVVTARLDPLEALALWEHEGRPGRERYGVTVRGERQWAWLDDPEGPYAWPLGPAHPERTR
ncbi:MULTISPECIES: methyltransferase domain-containing protein [unclassified Streptomyces]|uniref:methyltransferase domain-containing protein n=1 Tax=unclassified Streptomyces TaxID=2593676 RepID=UPI00336A893D